MKITRSQTKLVMILQLTTAARDSQISQSMRCQKNKTTHNSFRSSANSFTTTAFAIIRKNLSFQVCFILYEKYLFFTASVFSAMTNQGTKLKTRKPTKTVKQ